MRDVRKTLPTRAAMLPPVTEPKQPVWAIFTAIILVGGVYAGIMEVRFRELSVTLEAHRMLPMHPQADTRVAVVESLVRDLSLHETAHELRPMHQQAEPKIAGLEQRMTRAEQDLRNHLEQFSILRQLLADHDERTRRK